MNQIKSNNYSIYFNKDGYQKLKSLISKVNYSNIFILADENTKENCLGKFISYVDISFNLIQISSGEKNKNLNTCSYVWKFLNKNKADRDSLLINLGGGVITDMGGFIASCYKRGIDFINIPTTLLSMVDASVGSKTGVNFDVLKNNIGIFSDPKIVIIDQDYLKTLDKRNTLSGYAEIFKHSLISGNLFDYLITNDDVIFNDLIIHNSIKVKNEIVKRDRNESDIRKSLNFGHTIGHAVESLKMSNNEFLLHGEAVVAGIIIELYLSKIKLGFPSSKLDLINNHLKSSFEKINLNKNEINELLRLIKFDKKNYQNDTNFVLLNDVGKYLIDQNVDEKEVKEAIEYYLKN